MEKTAARFIWHYAKIFKWPLFAMLVLLVLGQTCRQFVPYYLAQLYDAVANFATKPQLWQDILLIIFFAFVLQLAGQIIPNIGFIMVSRVAPLLRTVVIRDVFDYVNQHSIAFFTEEMAGNVSNKVQQLQSNTHDLFRHIIDSSWTFFYVIIGLVILSSVSLWLTPVFISGRF